MSNGSSVQAAKGNTALAVGLEDLILNNLSIFPTGLDKRPLNRLSWKAYQTRKATMEEVQAWNLQDPAGWAVICGALSGLVIVDFDGEPGAATMKSFGVEPHVRSGSGGYHLWVKHPGWHVSSVNCKQKAELGRRYPGVDVRGDGSYAVSVGRNLNGTYQWLRPMQPDSTDVLPDHFREFIGLLKPPERETAPEPSVQRRTKPVYFALFPAMPKAASGGRLDSVRLLSDALALADDGRNDAGFWLACQLRDNRFSESEAADVMTEYAVRVPPTDQHGKLSSYTVREALASLCQAYSRPARDPWAMPEATPESEAEQAGIVEQAVRNEAAIEARESAAGNGDEPGNNRAAEPLIDDPGGTDGPGEPEARIPAAEGPATRIEGGGPEQAAFAANKAASAVEAGAPAVAAEMGGATCPVTIPGTGEEEDDGDDDDDARPRKPITPERARRELRKRLNLDVLKVLKHGEVKGAFELHLKDGRKIDLGPAAEFTSARSFVNSVVDGIGVYLAYAVTPKKWPKILNCLLALSETVPGLTPDEMLADWLEEYLSANTCSIDSITDDHPEFIHEVFQQFKVHGFAIAESCDGGRLFLKLRHFFGYLQRVREVKLSEPDLARMLSKVGFRTLSSISSPTFNGERITVNRVWVIPRSKVRFEDNSRLRSIAKGLRSGEIPRNEARALLKG